MVDSYSVVDFGYIVALVWTLQNHFEQKIFPNRFRRIMFAIDQTAAIEIPRRFCIALRIFVLEFDWLAELDTDYMLVFLVEERLKVLG